MKVLMRCVTQETRWGRQHSTWIHVFLGGSWTHFEDVISLKKKGPALPQGLKERSLRG